MTSVNGGMGGYRAERGQSVVVVNWITGQGVGPERIPTSLARSQTRMSRPFRIWAPPGRFWVTAPRPSQACHCQADRMSPRSLWEQKPLNTTRYGSPGYWLVTSPRQMSYIHSMIQECRDVCTKDYGQIIQVTPLSRM